MVKNAQVKNGEEVRIESIARRKNEFEERKRLISQSLTGELKNKRIKFADSDEEELHENSAANKKPFSFLASIGRIYPEQNESDKKTNGAEKEEESFSCGISKLNNKSEGNAPKLKNPILLYKPQNVDDSQRQSFFFVTEHTHKIRSSFTSFRRHKKEETLRKEWDKLRAPIVKFYKKERKSALRHLRKGIEKKGTKQKEQNEVS